MYNATLEPLISECQKAIEFAEAGDIDEARLRLDRIRYLRSVMARAKQRGQSAQDDLVAMGADSAELLETYAQLAAHANRLLEILREWIRGSRSSFTMEELRASKQGIDLFIDDTLPGIWDFTQDIVVLTQQDGEPLRDALRERGQRRFIWVADTDEVDSDYAGILKVENEDTVYLAIDEDPNVDAMKQLIGEGVVPRLALIAHECAAWEEEKFGAINHAVASAIVRAATTQWISKRNPEQYLANLPRFVECRSVMSLRSMFDGADVLILSPGPSLKQDFELLKSCVSKFVTIAPVKSLEALFDEGIKPDFTIWQDPQDHSYAIPVREEIKAIPIILGECCHKAFFEAHFKEHFIYPDPQLLFTKISGILHGESRPLLAGTCVSTLATLLATSLGAASVTLLGQDLSVGGGQYVSPGAVSAEEKARGPKNQSLMCEAIGGGQLPTQPNYFGFIDEFKLIGAALNKDHNLINCTSSGAYLDGWDHMPLEQHPILQTPGSSAEDATAYEDFLCERDPAMRGELILALEEIEEILQNAGSCGRELVGLCLQAVQDKSNDVTAIEGLEHRLRELLEACHILKNYISPQSMAMQAAAESATSLEDNLRLSADYYEAIFQSAARLEKLCAEARQSLLA
jgi:hypothetical protein